MPRKKRAQTNIERYGFKDSDLTTPGHDAICIWVEENIEEVIKEVIGWRPHLTEAEIEQAMGQYRYQRKTLLNRSFIGTPKVEEERIPILEKEMRKSLQEYVVEAPANIVVKWEPSLTNSRDYEVGFLDLVAQYSSPCVDDFFEEYRLREVTSLEDVPCQCSFISSRLWFEIKTTIPSLGELFRQLSFYKNHVTEPIVVVSPDTRHKDRIQSQGYPFMAIPPSVLKKVKKEKPPQEEVPPTFQTETSSTTAPPKDVKQIQTLQLPFAGKKD